MRSQYPGGRRHAPRAVGYERRMGDREQIRRPVEERRPIDTPGVPEEEDVSRADAAERVDLDPDAQPNRPEQGDFDEAERRQYDGPPLERPIADADHPEDR